MKFGIVADDNTGATDAASMLTERGVRTVLFIGLPDRKTFRSVSKQYDAAVIGTGIRSIDPKEAYRRTYEAVKLLSENHVRKIQIKYCSTFDSTKKGNIGQSLDAAMEALKIKATIACPALPINGRTTVHGLHYVNGTLLSESSLKDHPLNPMTESDLVKWLQFQTKQKVGLLDIDVIGKGVQAVTSELENRGEAYFITDAATQEDIRTVAKATLDWPLISGGSGITAEMPDLLFSKRNVIAFSDRLSSCPDKLLVVAGSCSEATRKQNGFAMKDGFHSIKVSGPDILDGKADSAEAGKKIEAAMENHGKALLFTSADPDEVKKAQAQGESKGLTIEQTGLKIGEFLAEVCAHAVETGNVGRLIISGGETSGMVCSRLGFTALEVGLPVAPGVPYCFPLERQNLMVVLKSGNFGSDDFYAKVKSLGN